MNFSNRNIIIYLGYNSFFKHKRGVENVITFQGKANNHGFNIYIHWDDINSIKKYNEFVCIGIKKNFFWPFFLNFILIKLYLKYKRFLLHSHNPLMSLVSILRTQIFTVHDPLYYLTKARSYKFTSLFFILERILYCRVNLVHFISNYAKEMSLLPSKNRYKIIHNTSFLEDSLKSNSIVREKVFCEVTQILIVRSIELRARLDLILEVAKHLGNNYEFTIVGKGPLLDYFVNKVKFENINNINFKSYIPDLELIEYYSNTDIVIVPAEFGEGFGLPIIEGYLFNKIVLASNKCAIPEIIFSDVFLFDNNVSSIVDKILSTKCMKKYNFEGYYYEKFSNKIILNKFRQLYSMNI